MPICCEPGERFPIVLSGDKGRTPEPTFWARHLPARQFRLLTQLGERMAGSDKLERQIDLLDEALQLVICGWGDLTDAAGRQITFDATMLLDILTVEEASDLLRMAAAGQRLSGEDAKKSGSPSRSDGESIAAANDQGAAGTAPI